MEKNKENKNTAVCLDGVEIKQVYFDCMGAYYGYVYAKSMMDAIVHMQDSDKTTLEKLKHLEDVSTQVEEELYSRIPVGTVLYDGKEYEDMIMDEMELKYQLAQILEPYMEKIQKRYTKEQESELFAFRNISHLTATLMKLVEITTINQVYNRKRKMELLLELVEAILGEAKEFWCKWSYQVEEISHNLPLDKIVAALSKAGYAGFEDAVELMLPEVVATFLINYKDGIFLMKRLRMLADKENETYEDDLEGYKQVLESLEKGFLLQKNIPLKEQLYGLNNNIIITLHEVQMYCYED